MIKIKVSLQVFDRTGKFTGLPSCFVLGDHQRPLLRLIPGDRDRQPISVRDHKMELPTGTYTHIISTRLGSFIASQDGPVKRGDNAVFLMTTGTASRMINEFLKYLDWRVDTGVADLLNDIETTGQVDPEKIKGLAKSQPQEKQGELF